MNYASGGRLQFLPIDRLLSILRNPGVVVRSHLLFQIHSQLLTNPCLQSHHLILTHFTSSFLRSVGLGQTVLLLQHHRRTTSSLWDLVIRASAKSQPGLQFFGLYNLMRRRGVLPDTTTMSALLHLCVGVPDIYAGEAVHCQIVRTGLGSCVILATALLDYYWKSGHLGLAEKVFVGMPQKDVIAINAMIAALGNHGHLDDSRKLFDEMVERNTASWNSMISCYCRHGYIDLARKVFERCPIKDTISWNSMIVGYCKLGPSEMALELFNKMGSMRNTVTWNTMITCYIHHKDFGTAILLFRKMQLEKVRPTEVTMAGLLSACAHLGALDLGRWIHAYIRNNKLRIDVVLGNALIDMYFKCGVVSDAMQVFQSMPVRNVFCWNTVIVGLGMHGYGDKAIEIFQEMQKEKRVRPDGVTFVGLLSGCSHSGLVTEGRNYFSHMLSIYGVEPNIEHYGCMVDLLGRAGLLREAMNLINKMPFKPNSVVWGSLFCACRIHGNSELCEELTQKLLDLHPFDGGNYVFLSNTYAFADRWDDVQNCRTAMLESGVRKIPGCASIEVDNVVHEFLTGDNSHPLSKQINAVLDEIAFDLGSCFSK